MQWGRIRPPRQRSGESEAHAAILAREIGLDMTAYWQPIAASYFGRVSKERIVKAVHAGASAQGAENIARMKKQAMVDCRSRSGRERVASFRAEQRRLSAVI